MARTANLYRTPPDPGFVGGYNWAESSPGLLLLIAVNVAATQFIAYRFALSTRSWHAAAASPGRQRISAVRVGELAAEARRQHRTRRFVSRCSRGALIVVVGSALAVALVYGLNIRRAKRLSENAEDLHGSARWAVAGRCR